MDEAWLRSRLESGRSIESIAREAEKSASTVAYWVTKYGLVSAHARVHAARGGVERERLEELLGAGLSIRAIAAELGVSYTTVRHWLARHGLSTPRARRLAETAAARETGEQTVEATCPVHGLTPFVRRRNGGFRCRLCRSAAVDRRRRAVKRILVEEAGGACGLCGYDRYAGALQFHHIVPAEKSFGLSDGGVARSLERARREAAKCVLVCANCHAEIEAGLATIAGGRTCR